MRNYIFILILIGAIFFLFNGEETFAGEHCCNYVLDCPSGYEVRATLISESERGYYCGSALDGPGGFFCPGSWGSATECVKYSNPAYGDVAQFNIKEGCVLIMLPHGAKCFQSVTIYDCECVPAAPEAAPEVVCWEFSYCDGDYVVEGYACDDGKSYEKRTECKDKTSCVGVEKCGGGSGDTSYFEDWTCEELPDATEYYCSGDNLWGCYGLGMGGSLHAAILVQATIHRYLVLIFPQRLNVCSVQIVLGGVNSFPPIRNV